jgi:hypothetical protein
VIPLHLDWSLPVPRSEGSCKTCLSATRDFAAAAAAAAAGRECCRLRAEPATADAAPPRRSLDPQGGVLAPILDPPGRLRVLPGRVRATPPGGCTSWLRGQSTPQIVAFNRFIGRGVGSWFLAGSVRNGSSCSPRVNTLLLSFLAVHSRTITLCALLWRGVGRRGSRSTIGHESFAQRRRPSRSARAVASPSSTKGAT